MGSAQRDTAPVLPRALTCPVTMLLSASSWSLLTASNEKVSPFSCKERKMLNKDLKQSLVCWRKNVTLPHQMVCSGSAPMTAYVCPASFKHRRTSRNSLTSTCTASDVHPTARTRTAMAASVAFMVTVHRDTMVGGLAMYFDGCSARCVLYLCPRPPFKQFCSAWWSCDQKYTKWEQSFSHGLMSSDRCFTGL